MIDKVAEVLIGPPPPEATPPVSKVAPPTPRDGRQRSTLNLSNIGKVVKTADEVPVTNPVERVPDKPIDTESLRSAWAEFTALRKNQVGEHELLSREYQLNGTMITIPLVNGIEEPMLVGMRTSLITFLRDRLGNSSLMVQGKLQEVAISRKIHTSKEKFEHFAEKNPVLKDLKERFGLDPDL